MTVAGGGRATTDRSEDGGVTSAWSFGAGVGPRETPFVARDGPRRVEQREAVCSGGIHRRRVFEMSSGKVAGFEGSSRGARREERAVDVPTEFGAESRTRHGDGWVPNVNDWS